jgi:chitosanase
VSGAFSSGQRDRDTVYCRDSPSGSLFLKDTGGGYADVDVDCDGVNSDQGDCHLDPTGK